MVASPASSVFLACPGCGTRYQLPAEAIGPKGRKVTCAHCRQTWQAKGVEPATSLPDPDRLFDDAAERELDRAFAEAEAATHTETEDAVGDARDEKHRQTIAEIKKAIAPNPASAEAGAGEAEQRNRKDFNHRQALLGRQLPFARLRRAARLVAVSLLAMLLALAIVFRAEIVREFPPLAGTYEALGLSVNIVGLEFRDVRTLLQTRDGVQIMQVDARIYSIAARRKLVPPVIVTLLDDEGTSIYEWSVRPDTRDMEPGEILDFSARLSAPPPGASRVRLSFAEADGTSVSVPAPIIEASN